jgi:hypothetical protein
MQRREEIFSKKQGRMRKRGFSRFKNRLNEIKKMRNEFFV